MGISSRITSSHYSLHSTWRNKQQILQTRRVLEHIWCPFVSVAYLFFGETRRTSNSKIDPELIGFLGSVLFFLFDADFWLTCRSLSRNHCSNRILWFQKGSNRTFAQWSEITLNTRFYQYLLFLRSAIFERLGNFSTFPRFSSCDYWDWGHTVVLGTSSTNQPRFENTKKVVWCRDKFSLGRALRSSSMHDWGERRGSEGGKWWGSP